MNNLTIYRTLTFILMPFGAYFALSLIEMLPIAIANPIALFIFFLMVCFPIYTVCSSIFLFKGITKKQLLKSSLKDWIKVNGYGTIAYAVLVFLGTLIILTANKSVLIPVLKQMLGIAPLNQSGFTIDSLFNTIKIGSAIFAVLSLLILAHLYFTFTFLKKYQHLFGNSQQ